MQLKEVEWKLFPVTVPFGSRLSRAEWLYIAAHNYDLFFNYDMVTESWNLLYLDTSIKEKHWNLGLENQFFSWNWLHSVAILLHKMFFWPPCLSSNLLSVTPCTSVWLCSEINRTQCIWSGLYTPVLSIGEWSAELRDHCCISSENIFVVYMAPLS